MRYPASMADSGLCGRCGRPSPDIDLVCDHCAHITVFDGAKRRFKSIRLSLIVLIALVMIAALGAVTLFRVTGAMWPVYLLVASGIVGIFAVVTSRGVALPFVVVQLVIIVLIWATWEPLVHLLPGVASFVSNWWTAFVAGALVVGTAVAFVLGRATAIDGMRSPSSWYLAIATFVLGSWGAWGILLQSGVITPWIYQLVLVIALLIPLVLLLVILTREPRDSSRASWIAVWFLLVATYLTSVEYLMEGATFLFGDLLPALLEVDAPEAVQLPAWLPILRWKTLVTTIFAVGAIAFVGAASVIDTLGGFEASKRAYYRDALTRLTSRASQPGERSSQVNGQILALHFGAALNMLFDFTSRTAVTFVRSLLTIVKRSAFLLLKLLRYVLPAACLSVLAVLLIVTLKDYSTYRTRPGEFLVAAQLWGELIAVMILAVVLSALSFGLIRNTRNRVFVMRRRIFAGAESAALLMFGALYFPFSLIVLVAVVPLWFALESAGIDASAIAPGPILYVNAMALLAVGIVRITLRLAAPSRSPDRYSFQVNAIVITTFAIAAVALSMPPILDRITNLLG
jgi:hypothetical protein